MSLEEKTGTGAQETNMRTGEEEEEPTEETHGPDREGRGSQGRGEFSCRQLSHHVQCCCLTRFLRGWREGHSVSSTCSSCSKPGLVVQLDLLN